MAKRSVVTSIGVLLIALVLPAASAFATDTSKALSICISRGTACTVSNKGGGYEICVNNSGARECVKCPALTSTNQTCSVAKAARGDVTKVLQGVRRPLATKVQ